MKNTAKTFVLVLSLLLSSLRANAEPLTAEQLLAAAITDACRIALLQLDAVASFDPDRVTVSPSSDAAGAMDGWLPDSDALDRFARNRALGLKTPWLTFVDARHARRVLEAHYR